MKQHALEVNFLIGTRTASTIRNSICEHWRAKALSPMKRAPLFAGKPTDQANIFERKKCIPWKNLCTLLLWEEGKLGLHVTACPPIKLTSIVFHLSIHPKIKNFIFTEPRNAAAQTWRKHPKSGVACISQGFEAVTSRSAGSDKASQHCSKSDATLRKLHSCFTELVADSWLKRACASNASAWQRGRGKGAFGGWLQTLSRICCTVRFHWSVSGFSICSWIRRTRCSLGNLDWLTCQQRNKAMRLLKWFQWLVKEWWIILNHSQ